MMKMQNLINYFLNYPDVLKKLKSNEASLIGYDSIQTQIIIKGFENYLMMGADNKKWDNE
ncbi:competence pheromone ComX [Bacillus velezensis]|nr:MULTISPECIES: competence pheromone ComX [Bacillus]MDV9182872.1 competence pheromone ComX [Bacillus sp. 31]WPB69692.1 competence pheromone ComX [Bacillus velezensis]WPP13957.1 competence pheromone ComX [Bacillus velezensis]WPP17712.1 competence pheromone ComX [Bacillus velezensis]